MRVSRRLPPTLQAVADELGVDRKTLRRHANDRDGLMAMLAADAFQSTVAHGDFSPRDDWREAIRTFAKVTRDGIIAMRQFAGYVNLRSDGELQNLASHRGVLAGGSCAGRA